ncbi:transposase is4 [Holotrichia oblita]|uniref:Transposase is4 n=1 Tax=Holotrichia oblita TaxID=644536 RepID=A0ACB9TNM2_HOLOL|nr:transposase is4 [Holotrichia oblita]
MSYEAEQARLQLLMDECMNFDIEFDDEEDKNEVDNLKTFEEDTDTEQEVDDEDTVSETFEGPLFFGRDKKSKWRKHASTQKVKTRSKNIVTQLPGVRGPVKEVKEPLAIWKHFFDINLLNMIIDNTNKYIASVANNYSRDTYTRPTNLLEIQAVIGLLLLSGVKKNNHLNAADLFTSNGTAPEIYRLVMSLQRFRFLLRHLRFDDLPGSTQRWCNVG